MFTRSGEISLANLCNDLKSKRIRVNHDYQRLPKAWSSAARSYLIETILKGYPIPKIYLWQTTDLRTMKTEMEIVDGQQRVSAILAFLEGDFKVSTQGDYKGLNFATLDEEAKLRFLEYPIGTDTLAGATRKQVREVYRRINSYTTPLNAQEKRFAAAYGGDGSVKYYINDLADAYSDYLVRFGTLSESKIGRMGDQEWFAKVIDQLRLGIHTSAPKKLDDLYKAFDDKELPNSETYSEQFQSFFEWFDRFGDLHKSNLTNPEELLTLCVAYAQLTSPIKPLTDQGFGGGQLKEDAIVLRELTGLNAQLDRDLEEVPERDPYRAFVAAGTEATNTLKNRTIRVKYFISALCTS